MNENSISEKINRATEKLQAAGIDTPRLDAEVLLAHVLNCRRLSLYVNSAEELSPEKIGRYEALIEKRAEHLPVAYLTGVKEFMGMKFAVTPEILIPRPETEILAQGVIERLLLEFGETLTLADIGTGSGAVAISILKFIENMTAEDVDISGEAIAIAKFNAKKLGVTDRINFTVGDLFAPLEGMTFNVIVSNPPYIPTGDLANLQEEVKNEPQIALNGGEDGLDFYRRIITDAPDFLKPGGFLAVEVGINQADEVKKLIEEDGRLGEVEFWKDLANINRVVAARLQ